MRGLHTVTALLALAAACSDAPSGIPEPLLNRCTQTFECSKQDTCDSNLGVCVHMLVSKPYQYAVQVIADANADAGVLAPFTTVPRLLEHAENLGGLTVRPALHVRGSVLGSSGAAMQAEVVFTPRSNSALRRGADVFTGGTAQTYDAVLEPDTAYDVLIYPLGRSASRSFPPGRFELSTAGGDQAQDFQYPALVALTGTIRDENNAPPPAGLKIKLRSRNELLATSSIGDLEAGAFTVFAPPEVLAAPEAQELVLDLSGVVAPQNVEIVFDLAKQPPNGRWTIPVLPMVVQFSGSVEVSALSNAPSRDSNIDARLTWVSDFEPPAEPGDVRGRDWCELKLPGAAQDTFRCSARVDTSVGADKSVSVGLLPGDYQVFVAPTGAFDTPQRVATASFPEGILSQLTGVQSGRAFRLEAATLFNGRVLNASGKAMPAVTVTANALGILDGLDDVALFNRSDQQSSARDGTFKLAVDVGLYDLIATPPDGSGYAWVVTQNRRIDPETQKLLGGIDFPVTPQVPVAVRGQVVDTQGTPIVAARVDAFALVPDLAGGEERAIRIAHSVSDSMGEFVLQMPQSIGERDEPPLDGGVLSDAGTADAQP